MAKAARPASVATTEEPSDQLLLQQLRNGDGDAATRIYLRYAQRLRALARAKCPADLACRIDADDVVQSAFRSFFRKARVGLYDVPDHEELWRLLLVIALNKLRDQSSFHYAARRDVRKSSGSESLDRLVAARTRADDGAGAYLRMVIADVLDPLPPIYRQIVELRVAGHEVAEIAQTTGRSKRTVERTLQDVRTKLRGIFFEDE